MADTKVSALTNVDPLAAADEFYVVDATGTTSAAVLASVVATYVLSTRSNASVLDNTTASYTTAEETKLSGIETAADVTDATNVDAAGAVMESDISGTVVGTTDTQTLTNKTITSLDNDVLADEVRFEVYNASGGTLTLGTPVYASGFNVGENLVEVDQADASSTATMGCVGLVISPISNGTAGTVVTVGALTGINTGPFTVGDALYVSESAGGLTATKPTGSALVQKVAEVVRAGADGAVVVNLEQTLETGFTATLLDDGDASTARTTLGVAIGTDVQAHSAVLDATTASFTTADETKLDGIETAADVTDATNVDAAGAVMDSDISEGEGLVRKTGAGAYEAIKTNLGASTAPTASDDTGSGYAVGSRWIDTTADKEYVCLDASSAAAVWTETTQSGGGASSSTFIVKQSDESVTNSTTLQDDNDLTASVEADTDYVIKVVFFAVADSLNPDLKYGWSAPSGATFQWLDATTDNNPQEKAVGSELNAALSPTSVCRVIQGTLRVSSTAGDLTFRWAQNTQDASNATTIKAGSSMTLGKVV